MNINGINANNNLIDVNNVNKVSADLFAALKKKSVDYSKQDLTRFTRATLGVDLYSQKTDINVQRQIAITNSGAFQNNMNLQSVQALNSFAAQNLYANSVQNAVGGKMTIAQTPAEIEFVSRTEDVSNLINVFETDKDKKDSNPFAFDTFTPERSQKQEA